MYPARDRHLYVEKDWAPQLSTQPGNIQSSAEEWIDGQRMKRTKYVPVAEGGHCQVGNNSWGFCESGRIGKGKVKRGLRWYPERSWFRYRLMAKDGHLSCLGYSRDV
jgi:hypothetical protein